jgi:hypothetical protein
MIRGIALALLLPLGACEGQDLPDVSDGPGVVRSYESGRTDGDGLYTVPVAVEGGVSRFMVTGWTDELVNVEEVRDPSGRVVVSWLDWYYEDEGLTWAFFEEPVSAINWPVREEDGPLQDGVWEVVLATTDNGEYLPNIGIEAAVHRVVDDNPAVGKVKVRIVYADGIDADEHVVGSVETAVERWREIWAAKGLTLVERYDTSALRDDLPFAYSGGTDVQREAAAGGDDELMLVIGELFPDGVETLGVSGGLPGSLEATGFKFVCVSWLAHAGQNALFDDDERNIMGETMAHEIGHFMGLFHPVEGSFDSWDALQDTPRCTAESACGTALGANNMYPYPLCDFRTCQPQGDVSQDQKGVLQRHVGAL